MWEPSEMATSTLMKHINERALGLPQFQRLAVWTQKDWIPFLASMLRGRPTGTLLLLECKEDRQEFAPRNIETAPELDLETRLRWLLLDGQQRLTTLYRAFHSDFTTGHGAVNYEFVIDVKAALDRKDLLDEDFTLTKKNVVPGFPSLAEAGTVTLKVLYASADFENWKHTYVTHHLTPIGRNVGDLTQDLDEVMPGAGKLQDYKFPVLKIEQDTPLDVVVDIFEGMNRRGQQLNQFDLMVAKLYTELPDGSRYNLRARWESKLEDSTHLKLLGFNEGDGMLPLQLIAKQVSRLEDDQRKGVKGLNNKDVLELAPEQVIEETTALIPGLSLSDAVNALEMAAEFLYRICGVRSGVLLPQKSMLIPLADQYLRGEANRLGEGDLKKWFQCIGLKGDYYGSVNSYANTDCDDLEAWADVGTTPDDVLRVNREWVKNLDLTQACSRDGRILGVAIMSLLVADGACDWDKAAINVKDKKEAVELHHMVPKKRLNSILDKADPKNPIAGLTPITASVNGIIGDEAPATVIEDIDKESIEIGGVGPSGRIMDSHQVDKDLLTSGYNDKANYDRFLKDREKRLRDYVIQSLGL